MLRGMFASLNKGFALFFTEKTMQEAKIDFNDVLKSTVLTILLAFFSWLGFLAIVWLFSFNDSVMHFLDDMASQGDGNMSPIRLGFEKSWWILGFFIFTYTAGYVMEFICSAVLCYTFAHKTSVLELTNARAVLTRAFVVIAWFAMLVYGVVFILGWALYGDSAQSGTVYTTALWAIYFIVPTAVLWFYAALRIFKQVFGGNWSKVIFIFVFYFALMNIVSPLIYNIPVMNMMNVDCETPAPMVEING